MNLGYNHPHTRAEYVPDCHYCRLEDYLKTAFGEEVLEEINAIVIGTKQPFLLNELPMSTRTAIAFRNAKIFRIADALKLSRKELQKVFGRQVKSLREADALFAEMGTPLQK